MRFDDAMTSASTRTWAVVIPVKQLAAAKSRIDARDVPSVEALALAFLQDTATAALACRSVAQVLVATSDERVSAWATAHGCTVVNDNGYPGINAAARHAAGYADDGLGVAVMVSDLPCLTPAGLTAVLVAAAPFAASFLADAPGAGTTIWAASPGVAVDPSFGPDSRRAHVMAGAVDLVAGHAGSADWRTARRDIDTVADLEDARLIGLGPATLAAWSAAQP
jgi:2-phospho-L-lactate guanylyltransferase